MLANSIFSFKRLASPSWGIALVLLSLGASRNCQAAEKYDLAVALTYSIAKFADFQDTLEASDIYIGVYGTGLAARAFAALEGNPLQGKTVHVVSINRRTHPKDIARCSILFTTEPEDLEHAVKSTGNASVLLVHFGKDRTPSAHPGLSLFLANQKIQFDVYLDSLRERKVRLDSNVLKLAAEVHRG